jgi:threonine aldolase
MRGDVWGRVGDDVYTEDPTINRLEQRAAEVFGREIGCLLAERWSSSCRQIAPAHGREVICEERGHVSIMRWRDGALFGLVARTVRAADGV